MVVSTATESNNEATEENSSNKRTSSRAVAPRRFYIDELGFYRHLDPDQRHYVCSNLNSANFKASGFYPSANDRKISTSSSSYEICFNAIREDLGISHFDRTDGYQEWKRSWDDFMRAKLTNSEPVTLNRELKTRVRTGIPHDYRCKVWSALIRMRTRSIRGKAGEDAYQNIIRDVVSKLEVPEYLPDEVNNNGSIKLNGANLRHRNSSNTSSSDTMESLKDKCFKQIELDLLRTLPNNRHFENPNSRGIQRVRRVLRAYAIFNPTVGYCQGMNRLAAMALLVLPEEEAFWCLVAIIQCIMPKDYYLKPWLAQVDCSVLSDLLEKKMPKLHKHLVKNDIQLTLFTWFFTIFVDGFRPELMLRIWDCFLLEGDKVLFRFALSILYISQDDLLDMQDFSTMSSHLSRLVSTRELDMDHLFESKSSS